MTIASLRAARLLPGALTLALTLAACAPDAPLAPRDLASRDLAAGNPHEGLHRIIQFFGSEFVPCAAGGDGEWVSISGTMHERWMFHVDAGGNEHVTVTMNPQGLTGTGEVTGDVYNTVGVLRYTANYDPTREVVNVANRTTFLARANGARFDVVSRYHVVKHPDGTYAVEQDERRVVCG